MNDCLAGASGQMQQRFAASFQSLVVISPSSPWLQDARQKFRSVLVEATVKLDELVKKIGKAVEDSKPYWEARRVARQVRRPVHCPQLHLGVNFGFCSSH